MVLSTLTAYLHEFKFYFFDMLVFTNNVMIKLVGSKNINAFIWLRKKVMGIVEQRNAEKVRLVRNGVFLFP